MRTSLYKLANLRYNEIKLVVARAELKGDFPALLIVL
jgi:hypothetical protein